MSDESEDDLGRELLQAVGRPGPKKAAGRCSGGEAAAQEGLNESRRTRAAMRMRRRGAAREEDSDEAEAEDEDEEEEDWGDGGKGKGKGKEDDGFAGSKAKSSIMPFKKRFDTGMVPEAPQSASKRPGLTEGRREGGRGGGQGPGAQGR